jgi:hypothetical protein
MRFACLAAHFRQAAFAISQLRKSSRTPSQLNLRAIPLNVVEPDAGPPMA